MTSRILHRSSTVENRLENFHLGGHNELESSTAAGPTASNKQSAAASSTLNKGTGKVCAARCLW